MQSLPQLDRRSIESLRPSVLRPAAGATPLDAVWEREAADKLGKQVDVQTIFLRGSECQFRCLMCDLWKFTHEQATPTGVLPAQIDTAMAQLQADMQGTPTSEQWVKLYNASNFFSTFNVPQDDLPRIAEQVAPFHRVVVENHPRLIGRPVAEFAQQINGQLEVAMGLETIHPEVLPALNKQMTTADFQRACQWLLSHQIDIRTFILLRPPGLSEEEGVQWCSRSIDFANEAGVRHISVIPVRGGNGALEMLQQRGMFTPPTARSLELVMQRHVANSQAILTVDLWDWDKLSGHCPACSPLRREALYQANLSQSFSSKLLQCATCDSP
ncbi:radical SAM protein [Aureliella helgolandensis]|uniref:Elp3/MiaA/NifB-like radical SAM core domain-containing protein n=1 Tax=Aureliella helgolandensis TaxID=2527968 RepID=A0A518G5A8_9BACT|nr:radical SAM protein [Aureliella helgolandensis]QDV23771.1 hypothetical protein Q31a_20760 [Aureliella helgolandensis]